MVNIAELSNILHNKTDPLNMKKFGDIVNLFRKKEKKGVSKLSTKGEPLKPLKRRTVRMSIYQSSNSPLWRHSTVIPVNMFKDSDKPVLRLFLGHPEIHDMMVTFARKEYSAENIFVWDNIQRYKRADDYLKRKNIALFIRDKFLNLDADMEVNITESSRLRIAIQIENEAFEPELFREAEAEVEECLADVYCRFIETQEYNQYILREKRKSVQQGDLHAMILTGMLPSDCT